MSKPADRDGKGYYYAVANGYKAFRFHTDLRESVAVDSLGSFKGKTQAHSKLDGYSLVKVTPADSSQGSFLFLRARNWAALNDGWVGASQPASQPASRGTHAKHPLPSPHCAELHGGQQVWQ